MRFLIIGGSDAGISGALRARELDPSAQITVVLADAFPNYSVCGIPFYISGETPNWRQLAHRTEFQGIEMLTNHVARSLNPSAKTVTVTHFETEKTLAYDQVLIATGARSLRPQIPGLSTDTGLGRVVESVLRAHGVRVESGAEVRAITQKGERLCAEAATAKVAADVVIVAAGVTPNAEIGEAAGVATGARGTLRVNRRMQTNLPDVSAAGDCGETYHAVLGSNTYLPLGTTAHKQGRVAGENAIGGSREFQGSLGTQVVKVFDLVVARTGFRDAEAREAGYDPVTVESEPFDHKAYYPGAQKLSIRVTGDRTSGRLLGAQIVGSWTAEVSKRVDILAAALYHGMTVEALNDLDLSCTHPLGSPRDAVQIAAQAWSRAERVTNQ